MAGLSSSLRVSELPSGVEHGRLIDKLMIHFLRPSNGGGEVVSITVSKDRPPSALITFEERKVTLSVLGHCPHVLELDGEKHELRVTLASPSSVNSDKVILSMSVTVNCHQLPMGKEAVQDLQRQFTDLCVSFPSPQQYCCTVTGPYSQVQPAVAQLLGLHESGRYEPPRPKPKEENGFLPATSSQMWSRSQSLLGQNSLGTSDSSPGQEAFGAEGGVLPLAQSKSPTLSAREESYSDEAEVDDLSLIMDSDQFLYLRRCEEYQRIMRDLGVEVVHETSEGLTTLFLQLGSKATEGLNHSQSMFAGRAHRLLRRAHKELQQLQLQQEGCLRKDHLKKSSLYPQGGLSKALETIHSLLPKLLLTQDDKSVYIVGESSDVSQAKQLLLLGHRPGLDVVSTSVTSSTLSSTNSLFPATGPPAQEQGEHAEPQPAVEDARLGKMLRSSGGDRKQEYKLAARFKSSVGSSLGFKPGEFGDTRDQRELDAQRLNGKNRTPSTIGSPLSNRDVKMSSSEAGIEFKPFPVSVLERTADHSLLRGPRPQATTAATPMSTAQSIQVHVEPRIQDPPALPSATRSTLRRASSFSGGSRSKCEERQDESSTASGAIPRTRPRSNSITSGVHSAEVIVPQLMWSHMKEAYGTRLEDMMSDLQISELTSETDNCIKVVLKGADSSTVVTCQRELQKLVSMVTSDFNITRLPLSDLGVAIGNELFEACCRDVHARYRKVSQRMVEGSLYLIGPKLLCEQVNTLLREVFTSSGEQKASSTPPQSSLQHTDPLKVYSGHASTHKDHLTNSSGSSNHSSSLKRHPQEGEKAPLPPDKIPHRKRSSHTEPRTASLSQPGTKQAPVTKEKVERTSAAPIRKSKTHTSPSHSPESNQGAGGPRLEERAASLPVTLLRQQDIGKQADPRPSAAVHMRKCICGESSPEVVVMACGLSLCPHCVLLHDHCKTCSKTSTEKISLDQDQDRDQALMEQAQAQRVPGIHGTINCVELPLSLQGHARDTTVKLTYLIPDGIQDEGHPLPGSPFKGGVFEAYLPLSARGRSLLPLLERAFHMGLTFTISSGRSPADGAGRVVWHKIPHKMKMDGGRSGNGYPDSNYLTRLSEALKAHGVEDMPAGLS